VKIDDQRMMPSHWHELDPIVGMMMDDSATSLPSRHIRKNKLGQVIGRKGHTTRSKLLAATRRLLEKYGQVGEIRVSEIVSIAKVSQASFYSYFSDIDDAVLEVVHEVSELNPSVTAILSEPWAFEEIYEKCYLVAERYMAFWRDHDPILWARNVEADKMNHRFFQEKLRTILPLQYALANKIREHHSGADRFGPGLDSMSIAVVLVAAIERLASVQLHTARMPVPFPTNKMAESCAYLMWMTLTAGTGATFPDALKPRT
jgi:AcrR family transcriptional regulator